MSRQEFSKQRVVKRNAVLPTVRRGSFVCCERECLLQRMAGVLLLVQERLAGGQTLLVVVMS